MASVLTILLSTLSSFVNIASMLILKAVAVAIVLAIQALKAPGLALNLLLKHAAQLVTSVFHDLLELVLEAITSLIYSTFDFLVHAVLESLALLKSVASEFVGQIKAPLDQLYELITEHVESITDITWNVTINLWNNLLEATQYVLENA